jgi:hypothetical protein
MNPSGTILPERKAHRSKQANMNEWTNQERFHNLAEARLSVFRYIESFTTPSACIRRSEYLPFTPRLLRNLQPAGIRKSWAIATIARQFARAQTAQEILEALDSLGLAHRRRGGKFEP